MIDSSKRKTLMSLGGMMTIPFVPGMASALTSDLAPSPSAVSLNDANDALQALNDGNLNISLEFENGIAMMKVTNTSDELTILRRIHPGIVHVGNKAYDLNHALISSAYAIGAGITRRIPIGETTSTASEPALAARYSQKPLRVASISSIDANGLLLNTSRSYFS